MGSPERPIISSSALHPEDLSYLTVEARHIQTVSKLMTSKDILRQREFEKPHVINPFDYPDFASLLSKRHDIRNLKLVPIKTDEDYVKYHTYSKTQLKTLVDSYYGNSLMAFSENAFPYFLPKDVGQYIAWIKDDSLADSEVINFIAKLMNFFKKDENEVILFERPLMTSAKYVRGTMPVYRHVHMWIKK